MREYGNEIKKMIGQMMLWGILVLIAAYNSGNSEKMTGLAMGIFASVIYFLLMCYRVKKSIDMPVGRALLYTKIGWLIRLAFIVMMLLLAAKLPGIDFWAAVFGLFTLQMILFLQAVALVAKSFLANS